MLTFYLVANDTSPGNRTPCSFHLEASLNMVLQAMRGTRHYWYLKKSDLNCMFRKNFCHTQLLRIKVPRHHWLPEEGKRCLFKLQHIEAVHWGPSIWSFLQSFTDCGAVLGKVDYYYWQACGTPHYCGSNGVDLSLTCDGTPHGMLDPELHRLVTKYQAHKCIKYCRSNASMARHSSQAAGSPGIPAAVPYCTMFSRRERKCVSFSTMSQRGWLMTLILMLWKANMDIVATESSLILAHCLSTLCN